MPTPPIYSASSAAMFEAENQKWLVSDRPEKNALTIQRDMFGHPTTVEPLPRETFERAATAFLEASGRHCKVTSGVEAAVQIYEFAYGCERAG